MLLSKQRSRHKWHITQCTSCTPICALHTTWCTWTTNTQVGTHSIWCLPHTTNSTMLLWKKKDTAALGCLVGTSVCSTTLQWSWVVAGLLAGRLKSCGAAGPPGQLEIRLITQNSCSASPHSSCREGTNTKESGRLRIWSIIENSCRQLVNTGSPYFPNNWKQGWLP